LYIKIKQKEDKNMENILQIPATDAQRVAVATFLAGLGFTTVKTKTAANFILQNKKDFTKKFKALLGETMTESDYVINYKKDIEKFFLEIYGQTLDLTDVTFLENGDHFMVNPGNLTSDAIYAGFKTMNFAASKYINGSIDTKRSGGKSHEPVRPSGLYPFTHRGGEEPDAEHLNKNYNMFSIDGKNYMTINEYMLVYQFMYWKFKIKLDKNGWTRTSSLDSGGCVMCGSSNGVRFELSWGSRDGQSSGRGPREVFVS
jgi:hypothetical protein